MLAPNSRLPSLRDANTWATLQRTGIFKEMPALSLHLNKPVWLKWVAYLDFYPLSPVYFLVSQQRISRRALQSETGAFFPQELGSIARYSPGTAQ
jgi:hypothetical protein